MAITDRKLANGKVRYDVRLRDPSGTMKSKTFRTKDNAKRWEREQLTSLERGGWIDPSAGKVTLAEWVEDWQSTVVDLRESTQRIYADNLRLHIVPELGDVPLGLLTPTLLTAWLAELRKKPSSRRRRDDAGELIEVPLAPASVDQAYRTLHRVLQAAVEAERLARNPLVAVKRPKVERHEMLFATPAQVAALVEAIDDRFRAFVLLGAYTGLRAGELRALKRRKLDLLRRVVTVDAQVVDEDGVAQLVAYTKTPASRRSVALAPPIIPAIEHHLATYVDAGAGAYVLTNPDGHGPLNLNNFRRRQWKTAVKAAGLPDGFRIHDLRHTFASWSIAAGADLKVLQTALGHASATVTLDTYGHLMPGQSDELARRLGELFDAAQPVRSAKVLQMNVR